MFHPLSQPGIPKLAIFLRAKEPKHGWFSLGWCWELQGLGTELQGYAEEYKAGRAGKAGEKPPVHHSHAFLLPFKKFW